MYPLLRALIIERQAGLGELAFYGVLTLLGICVALQVRMALRIGAAILLVAAFVLPLGVMNPFTAGDYLAQGQEPPSMASILGWLIPVEIFILAVAWLLDLDPRRLAEDESLSDIGQSFFIH